MDELQQKLTALGLTPEQLEGVKQLLANGGQFAGIDQPAAQPSGDSAANKQLMAEIADDEAKLNEKKKKLAAMSGGKQFSHGAVGTPSGLMAGMLRRGGVLERLAPRAVASAKQRHGV